ncbi:unnamed protein product [Trichobilharzia regenti]|nr:unnamed protein product [Trichobilharzia regenti]
MISPSGHFYQLSDPRNHTNQVSDDKKQLDSKAKNSNLQQSGVIQEGDRVICINGQSTLNRTIDELIQRYLQPIDFEKKYFRVQSLTLLIQYTVADSVVPATGIFDVKLIRRSASLGINLQGEKYCVIYIYIYIYIS